MSGNLQIRCCSQDDVRPLMQFIDRHWRPGHVLARDEGLLRWQFDHTRVKAKPFPGPSVLLAWEGERIVGMLGLISFDLNVRGVAIPGVWLSHWLSIPEARTRGVGLELLWAVHKLGYEAIFALGINRLVARIYSGLGFEILTDMPRWIRVFDISRAARLLEETGPEREPNTLHDLCAEYSVDREVEESANPPVEVLDFSGAFGADWDSFWTHYLAPWLVGVKKDSSYLNWRYVGHPIFRYQMRLAREDVTGRVLGLIVFRVEQIREREERVLRVVEFLSTPEAEGALANSVVQGALGQEVVFADFYCTSDRFVRALESVGFGRHLPDEEGPSFPSRFQPLEPGPHQLMGAFWLSETLRRKLGGLLAQEDFYITKSDSDQDRPN